MWQNKPMKDRIETRPTIPHLPSTQGGPQGPQCSKNIVLERSQPRLIICRQSDPSEASERNNRTWRNPALCITDWHMCFWNILFVTYFLPQHPARSRTHLCNLVSSYYGYPWLSPYPQRDRNCSPKVTVSSPCAPKAGVGMLSQGLGGSGVSLLSPIRSLHMATKIRD